MPTTIEAVYEQGVLRPDQPIDLAEGSRVEIIVLPVETPSQSKDSGAFRKKSPAEIIAEIAALPMESSPDGFSGEDHDEVLYGWKKSR